MFAIIAHDQYASTKFLGGEKIFALTYEELVEILAAIRDTPIRGNECFDDAKEKAAKILAYLPDSEY